jgi:hypothetical protein
MRIQKQTVLHFTQTCFIVGHDKDELTTNLLQIIRFFNVSINVIRYLIYLFIYIKLQRFISL